MVLPGRFELPFAASETAALSIELREPTSVEQDSWLLEQGQRENACGLALILGLRLIDKLERPVFFNTAIIAPCASDAILIFGVAGTITRRGNFIKDRVLLTVHIDAFNLKVVAAGLTFDPQFVAARAPEGRHATFERSL